MHHRKSTDELSERFMLWERWTSKKHFSDSRTISIRAFLRMQPPFQWELWLLTLFRNLFLYNIFESWFRYYELSWIKLCNHYFSFHPREEAQSESVLLKQSIHNIQFYWCVYFFASNFVINTSHVCIIGLFLFLALKMPVVHSNEKEEKREHDNRHSIFVLRLVCLFHVLLKLEQMTGISVFVYIPHIRTLGGAANVVYWLRSACLHIQLNVKVKQIDRTQINDRNTEVFWSKSWMEHEFLAE